MYPAARLPAPPLRSLPRAFGSRSGEAEEGVSPTPEPPASSDEPPGASTASDGAAMAQQFRHFAATLPHAVWALRFEPPLPVALPLDEAVAHFVAHAIVDDANDAFARNCGFASAQEIIGRPLAEVTPFTVSQRHLVRRFLAEDYRLDQDGLTLHGDSYIITQQGYLRDGHLALVWGLSTSASQSSRMWEEEVERMRSQLASLGRDVHDGVGQVLTGLRLLADNLALQPGVGQALAARIADLAARAHAEAQTLGRSLSAAVPLGFEFRTALRHLCDEATVAGVPCHLSATPAPVFPPVAHLHLFRIAQEAVSNALRHARAQRLDIRFEPSEHGIALVIEDDGVGPSAWSGEGAGVGLANMRARAEALGGTLTVEERPGGGTRVCCTLAAGGRP